MRGKIQKERLIKPEIVDFLVDSVEAARGRYIHMPGGNGCTTKIMTATTRNGTFCRRHMDRRFLLYKKDSKSAGR